MECAYLLFDLIFLPKTPNADQSKILGGGVGDCGAFDEQPM